VAFLLTITGATGAGKSTLLSILEATTAPNFKAVLVPKYSTRQPRLDDSPSEILTVPVIPADCDLVYEQYGDRYGVSLSALHEQLSNGSSPAVVINDIRVLEEIRQVFGPLMRSLYIFRSSPTSAQIARLAVARGVSTADAELVRLRKAQAIFRTYIENIELFDYVIMNVRAIPDLRRQVEALVTHLAASGQYPLRGV